LIRSTAGGTNGAGRRGALDYWRDEQALHGHRLHTLELSGALSDIARFSWIFERPLPRLHRLRIGFFGPLDNDPDQSQLPVPAPLALQLPVDLPLQALDLTNATLPWSSNLFAGLRELRMDFKSCEAVVDISADELLGVFDASPQLESLSLIQVRPRIPVRNGQPQYAPTRIAQLPNLASLKLDNSPEYASYTLSHMNIPAIDSLEIRFHVVPSELSRSLRFLLPNHRLPNRLFSNPPEFEIRITDDDGSLNLMYATIGGFKLHFDFGFDEEEAIRDAISTCVPPVIPPFAAILKLDNLKLSEEEWREFLRSHPEVHSIKFANSSVSKSLWDALSPTGTDAVPLCPKLESVLLFCGPETSSSLRGCLLNRKNAGFRLRCLEVEGLDDKLVEEFCLLVEELQVIDAPDDSFNPFSVRPILMNELGFHALTALTPNRNTIAAQGLIATST